MPYLSDFADEEGPFGAEPQRLERVIGELGVDLIAQLADGIAMPALLGFDCHGALLSRDLAPIDTSGQPISDFEVGRLFSSQARSSVVAMGHVRIDCPRPRILAWCLDHPLTATIEAVLSSDPPTWPRVWAAELDRQPRGGSAGATLAQGFAADPMAEFLGLAAAARWN